jgi:hypothetical protein
MRTADTPKKTTDTKEHPHQAGPIIAVGALASACSALRAL